MTIDFKEISMQSKDPVEDLSYDGVPSD
jgi:hypothetical protein